MYIFLTKRFFPRRHFHPLGKWIPTGLNLKFLQFSSVQFSCSLCPTLCNSMNRSTPGLTIHHQLLEFTQTHVHQVGNAILAPIPPSLRVFSNESALCMRWPNNWSFSLSISPSNEHSGRISFRTDWLDLLAVQGTLKNLLQHHSSKASVLRCPAFFYSSNMWTVNFQMFKLVLEKAEEPEIKLPTSAGSSKKQESSRKTSISALLTMPKPLTVWITISRYTCTNRYIRATCFLMQ